MFLSSCILSGVIIITPNAVDAGITDTFEELGYSSMELAIIASGETPDFASCFAKMLRMTGATEDFLNVDVNRLKEKSQLADFICSNEPLVVVFTVVLFLIFVTCVCCCCCKCLKWMCCGKDQTNPIQFIVPTGKMMRSQKLDKIDGTPTSYIQMA